MSAYGHQMEREYSAQSISSEGGSDMGSRYALEMGIYMSSYAATVLIAALVTLGVSLLTLVIALTVMLRSCQTMNAGAVETQTSSYDYDYCQSFVYHAELNGLDASSFPVTCEDVLRLYVEGQYLKDLNITIAIAEVYLSSVTPLEDDNDVIVMDVDDLLPSDFSFPHLVLHRSKHFSCSNCARDAKYQKHMFIQSLYLKLCSSGWRLILLSGRSEKLRNATEKYLISAGCNGWQELSMRTDDDLQLSTQEYLAKQRIKLHREGYRIVATISSQMDALTGLHLGRRVFKLPNFDLYDSIERYLEAQKG